jgi:hypothetical protein
MLGPLNYWSCFFSLLGCLVYLFCTFCVPSVHCLIPWTCYVPCPMSLEYHVPCTIMHLLSTHFYICCHLCAPSMCHMFVHLLRAQRVVHAPCVPMFLYQLRSHAVFRIPVPCMFPHVLYLFCARLYLCCYVYLLWILNDCMVCDHFFTCLPDVKTIYFGVSQSVLVLLYIEWNGSPSF